LHEHRLCSVALLLTAMSLVAASLFTGWYGVSCGIENKFMIFANEGLLGASWRPPPESWENWYIPGGVCVTEHKFELALLSFRLSAHNHDLYLPMWVLAAGCLIA